MKKIKLKFFGNKAYSAIEIVLLLLVAMIFLMSFGAILYSWASSYMLVRERRNALLQTQRVVDVFNKQVMQITEPEKSIKNIGEKSFSFVGNDEIIEFKCKDEAFFINDKMVIEKNLSFCEFKAFDSRGRKTRMKRKISKVNLRIGVEAKGYGKFTNMASAWFRNKDYYKGFEIE